MFARSADRGEGGASAAGTRGALAPERGGRPRRQGAAGRRGRRGAAARGRRAGGGSVPQLAGSRGRRAGARPVITQSVPLACLLRQVPSSALCKTVHKEPWRPVNVTRHRMWRSVGYIMLLHILAACVWYVLYQQCLRCIICRKARQAARPCTSRRSRSRLSCPQRRRRPASDLRSPACCPSRARTARSCHSRQATADHWPAPPLRLCGRRRLPRGRRGRVRLVRA